ncbi:hypothetical protein GCM10011482_23930 [Enterococcus alcedinis]|uniref:acetyl-CoA C-acetyltransferase n=1 Tax=Enterococcus alcedinis TaxID=1274384 RepID=A0A917N618_9ENTE|nr:acetyl-CoA acetyltransferase family protein [Enterococcus alcedinis]GGI66739.1 hypothetical protein GCM10011482_23930 [Enterococcus alcedinis]
MKEVVIIDALRTPIGKYHGQLKQLSAVELGTAVTKEMIARNATLASEIKQVIFGNVLQAGVGQNPARQVALKSGLSVEVPATTINEVCGSGLKAAALGRQLIQLGEADVVLVGGMESMSQAPLYQYYDKKNDEYTKPQSIMVHDGLTDAFSEKHMGLTAEKVAEQYDVTREEQDVFAMNSHKKAAHARDNAWFEKEIVGVEVEGTVMKADEGIRPETTIEKLGQLRTVFKEDGRVTAGNASTINDGASALLLASKEYADQHGISYLGVIRDVTEVGIDPSVMGISPIKAIQSLFERNQLTKEAIDLFEINEAFAATSLVVEKELALPSDKVNIAGGGISLGHPIGATGARIITTALHQLERIDGRYAVVSLCVGGGIGLAMLLERTKE